MVSSCELCERDPSAGSSSLLWQPEGALLLGSVPLRDAEKGFTTASSLLGDRLRRIPDGETGPRWNWIAWQVDALAAHPGFEQAPPQEGALVAFPLAKLRQGIGPGDVTFASLGVATECGMGRRPPERIPDLLRLHAALCRPVM